MTMIKVGVVYKITYPNGKIYIGQDRTDDVNYFGSADSFTISKDLTAKQKKQLTVTKDILWKHGPVSIAELNRMERLFIAKFRSNDSKVGYNRKPGNARRKCVTLFCEGE